MKWNDAIEIIKRNDKVAIVCYSKWIKLTVETYLVIDSILTSGLDIVETEDFFECREDYINIIRIVEKLKENEFIIENDGYDRGYDVTLLLTDRCNLNCRHCCQNANSKDYDELTLEQYKKIIDDLSCLKINSIAISGGEPLLRKDFFEILDYINGKLRCTKILMTNAMLINDDIATRLSNCIDKISVSIDGIDSESTQIVRGKDVYDVVVNNIEILKKHGNSDISLSAILPDSEEVEQIFENQCKELGVMPMLRTISLAGRGKDNYKYILSKYDEYMNKMQFTKRKLCYESGIENINTCSAGKGMFTIDSSGTVYSCNLLFYEEFSGGNILIDGLENCIERLSQKNIKDFSVFDTISCGGCEYKNICWHCMSELLEYAQNKEMLEKRCKIRKHELSNLIWGE